MTMVQLAEKSDPAVRADRLLFVIGQRDSRDEHVMWRVVDFDALGSPVLNRVALDDLQRTGLTG